MEFSRCDGVLIYFTKVDSDGSSVFVAFEFDVDSMVDDAFAFLFFVIWVIDNYSAEFVVFIIRGCERFCMSFVTFVCRPFTVGFAITT